MIVFLPLLMEIGENIRAVKLAIARLNVHALIKLEDVVIDRSFLYFVYFVIIDMLDTRIFI